MERNERRYNISLGLSRPFRDAFGVNAGEQLAGLVFALIRLAIAAGITGSFAYWFVTTYAPEFLERIAR